MLALDVVMPREQMASGDRLVFWIASGWGVTAGDCLRAAQMRRGLAGYFRAESQEATALITPFVSDLTQQMALAMVAGAAARSFGRSRRRYNDDTHVTVLAFVLRQAIARCPFNSL